MSERLHQLRAVPPRAAVRITVAAALGLAAVLELRGLDRPGWLTPARAVGTTDMIVIGFGSVFLYVVGITTSFTLIGALIILITRRIPPPRLPWPVGRSATA